MRDAGGGRWEDGRGSPTAAAGTLRSREKRASALPLVGRGEAREREGATGGEEGNRELREVGGTGGAGKRKGGVAEGGRIKLPF